MGRSSVFPDFRIDLGQKWAEPKPKSGKTELRTFSKLHIFFQIRTSNPLKILNFKLFFMNESSQLYGIAIYMQYRNWPKFPYRSAREIFLLTLHYTTIPVSSTTTAMSSIDFYSPSIKMLVFRLLLCQAPYNDLMLKIGTT